QLSCLEYLVDSGARLDMGDLMETTALMLASGRGHENCLRALLDATPKEDLDAADASGRTAAHHACQAGEAGALSLLAAGGANLDLPSGELEDGYAMRPAHVAVAKGFCPCIVELASWGADLEARDGAGDTVLALAVEHAAQACVDHLVSGGAGGAPMVDLERPGARGRTPLHVAARRGSLGLVAALLKAGAKVRARDRSGATPVHLAARNGHVPALEALLTVLSDRDRPGWAGIGVGIPVPPPSSSLLSPVASMVTALGETPTFLAAQGGHLAACRVLRELGALDPCTPNLKGATPILAAASGRNGGVVDLLAEAGGNVNLADTQGVTPAMAAARAGDQDLLKALEAWGASLAKQDSEGRTVAFVAAQGGHLACLTFIVDGAADPATRGTAAIPDALGRTPLWAAAAAGHPRIIRFLISERLTPPGTRDGQGRTAVRAAAEAGHAECLKVLLEAGARPGVADEEGLTPVLAAAHEGHEACLRALGQAGADFGTRDACGNGAATFAAMGGHVGCLRALAKAGADLDLPNNEGHTPAFAASAYNRLECLSFLAEWGADLRRQDLAHGNTPAMVAASLDGEACLRLLVRVAGPVSLSDVNQEGLSVASFAALCGREGALGVVAGQGEPALLTRADKRGSTPAHCAAVEGHVGCLMAIAEGVVAATRAKLRDQGHGHRAKVQGPGTVPRLSDGGGRGRGRKGEKEASALAGREALSATNAAGETPLHVAARAGRVSVVAYLLFETRVGAEERNLRGETCLWLAAVHGETETLELLVRQGLAVNARDRKGRTPGHAAAMQGHATALRVLAGARAGAGAGAGVNPRGLRQGNSTGFDRNAADGDGATPLHLAAAAGHVAAVRALTEVGARVDVVDKQGLTPAWHAVYNGKTDFVSPPCRFSFLHVSFFPQAGVLEILASQGAVLDRSMGGGTTLAHLAAAQGSAGCMQVLCKRGVDLDVANQAGSTPAMFAAKANDIGILKILADHGCDLSIGDIQAVTPVFFAAQEGHATCLDFLLARGADPDAARADGTTPLIIASQNGHLDCVSAILVPPPPAPGTQNKAIVPAMALPSSMALAGGEKQPPRDVIERRTSSGYTALCMAAVGGHPGCVERLIGAGANVDAADGKDRSPLFLAAAAGDATMCSLLVKRGASLRRRAGDGMEPVFAAAVKGHVAAVEAILRGGLDPETTFNPSGVPLSKYLVVLRDR
ncbi:unnamed protein product, partial [Discosporangium mesarthrocarpum]